MVPRRIDARWWVGVWCCFDVGLSSHVDKLTGSTMASHQQPPFNYRPFEDLMWRSSRNYTTVRSSDVAVAVSGEGAMRKGPMVVTGDLVCRLVLQRSSGPHLT